MDYLSKHIPCMPRRRNSSFSYKFNSSLLKLLPRFIQVFITFSREQSRYLGTRKIHGAKSGSHDRRFTDFGATLCSCRSIEVIAVHVVNSSSNNPDYSLSLSLSYSLFLTLFFFLSLSFLLTLTLLLSPDKL